MWHNAKGQGRGNDLHTIQLNYGRAPCPSTFLSERVKHRCHFHWHVFRNTTGDCCWPYPRTTAWWDNFGMCVWDDEHWIMHFRMSHSTLYELAEALHVHLTWEDTNTCTCIPVLKRVAIMVRWVANIVSYHLLGEQFGIGLSTAGERVIEVCFAMELDLLVRKVKLREVGRVRAGCLVLTASWPFRNYMIVACCDACG